MSLRASAESTQPGRAVAVTAIEHGNIIITVASWVREAELSPVAEGTFVTTILGGPLRGEMWAGKTWKMMLRNHAGAVSRVAEFIEAEAR
jgi:hypothetical protein